MGILNRLFALAFLYVFFSLPAISNAAGISGQGTWETTLLGRNLNGDPETFEAYYDTVLDITWLANGKATEGSVYDSGGGYVTWAAANAWAASLDFNGINQWRLPYTNSIDGSTADDLDFAYNGTEDAGYNVSAPGTLYAGSMASEMAHLYYNTLGNPGKCDPVGSTTTTCGLPADWQTRTNTGWENTGPFSNVQGYYWSATEFAPDANNAWAFRNIDGRQDDYAKTNLIYAWAVHEGDVFAAPVPASVWLFVSGLLGLIHSARHRNS